MVYRIVFLLSLLMIGNVSNAQDSLAVIKARLVSSYINAAAKAGSIDQKLDKYMDKALNKVQKQEGRIKRKLEKIDSLKGAKVFANTEQQYKRLLEKLQHPGRLQHFIPSLDSLSTSLKFLQENEKLMATVKGGPEKLKQAMDKIESMEGQMQKAEEIKNFIRARKQYLKEQLQNMGFAKELKKLSKQAWYASERLKEYKEMLKNHKKAERKMIALLSKTQIFKNFMRKNSMLASLFRLPGNDDPFQTSPGVGSLAGLQTRTSVNALIQNQLSSGDPAARQQLQQNIQQAQTQLSELKNKMNKLGSSSSDAELPGFKVNDQRKKSFWKKWETGINFQNNRANGLMPVSSDIGLSAGFKPNNWFTGGVGFAGRIGWGKNIRHLSVSYSGISVRSFAEFRLKSKGNFHAVAGYEKNFRPEIRNIEQLKDKSGWQSAGLLGLSKTIALKTKFLKMGKISLLWDFLSYQQVPKTQPIVLRIGYNLSKN